MKYISNINIRVLEDDCDIWVVEAEHSALLRISKSTGAISYVHNLGIESYNWSRVSFIYKYNNKLLMIPWNDANIYIYDINNDQIRKIDIRWNTKQYNRLWNEYVVNGNKLILISWECDHIIEFDMDKEKMYMVYSKDNEVIELENFGPIVTEKNIYRLSKELNLSWKFDIKTKTFCEVKFCLENTFISGTYGNGYIWIMSDNGELFQYTEELKFIKKYSARVSGRIWWSGEYLIVYDYNKNNLISIPYEKELLNIKKSNLKNLQNIQTQEVCKISNGFYYIENNNLVMCNGIQIKEYNVNDIDKKILENTLLFDWERSIFSGVELKAYINYVMNHSNREQFSTEVKKGNKIYNML